MDLGWAIMIRIWHPASAFSRRRSIVPGAVRMWWRVWSSRSMCSRAFA